MQESEPHLIVVGAGISGLTTAWRLQEKAKAAALPVRITILEQAEAVGGKLLTENVEGYTIEHGPDVFLAKKPWALTLCRDLGLEDELQPTNPNLKGSYIQQNGKLHPLPPGFSGVVPTELGPLLKTPLLSWAGKVRLAFERFIRARRSTDDEPLGAFVRRRIGRNAYERLVHPLLSGIYGGDIDEISLQATFPQFHELEREHGSLIRGIRRQRQQKAITGPAFVTLKGGLAALPHRLVEVLDADLKTGTSATRIERFPADTGRANWTVHTKDGSELSADAVVLSGPAWHSAEVVRSANEQLAGVLEEIPYNSSLILTLAFKKEDVSHPLDGYGYLIPAIEGKPIRAVTWSSSKILGRAPADGVLIRLFFGRSPEDPWLDASESDLLAAARDELSYMLGIDTKPVFYRVRRWLRAQPAYTMGHPDRLRRIDEVLQDLPGLHLCGSAYRGVGIPDCIHLAEQTASAVFEYLSASNTARS